MQRAAFFKETYGVCVCVFLFISNLTFFLISFSVPFKKSLFRGKRLTCIYNDSSCTNLTFVQLNVVYRPGGVSCVTVSAH